MKRRVLLFCIYFIGPFLGSGNNNLVLSQTIRPHDANGGQSHSHYFPLIMKYPELIHEEILIPAGEFQMGCDQNFNDGYDCNPQHQLHAVYLDDYNIDVYEVTNRKFATFLNIRGSNDCGPYNRCIDTGSSRISLKNGTYVVEAGSNVASPKLRKLTCQTSRAFLALPTARARR